MRQEDPADEPIWPQYYRRHLGTPEPTTDPFGAGVLLLLMGLGLLVLPVALLALSGVLFAKAAVDALRDTRC